MVSNGDNGDRRAGRPRISIGSMVGFGTIAGTTFLAVIAAALWLGSLDRGVTDTVRRMDSLERDSGNFQTEMRTTMQTLQQLITTVQILQAKQIPDAQPRRR